jgi:hypothetical protein
VVAQFAGNADSYTQINFQNINSSPTASGDYIITANNGTDSANFIDMGIAGNTWDGTQLNSLGNAVLANDGYLYVNGGNLVVGTFLNSGNVINTWKFNTNGTTIFPTLTVTRGDRTGTLTGQTLLFGDSTQEALISTPNGTNDINASQRFVINPGAGATGTTGEGGDIYLYAGRGGDAGGSGGDIKIRGGLGPVNGDGGYIDIQGGEADNDGTGGYIDILGGLSGNAAGGYVRFTGGQGQTSGGDANIIGGYANNGLGGNVNILGGSSGLGAGSFGNVNINTGNAGNTWIFDQYGNLTIPGNILGNGNILIAPDSANSGGYLNIYLTTGPDVHVASNSDSTLILGRDDYANVTVNVNGNVSVQASTGSSPSVWNFDTDGVLNLPGEGVLQSTNDTVTLRSFNTTTGNANSVYLGTSGGLGFGDTAIGGNWLEIFRSGTDPQIATPSNLLIRSDSTNTAPTWTFGANGNLTAPGAVSAVGNVTGGNVLTGGVVSATGNVTGGNIITTGNVTGNTAGYALGYRDIPQVSFTGNATINTTDAGKHYYSTLSTGNVLTIANNASQGFQVGAAITVINQGTGNITIAQGSGVTLYLAGNATAGNRTVATFGMATLIKVATDTWFINGTGVS